MTTTTTPAPAPDRVPPDPTMFAAGFDELAVGDAYRSEPTPIEMRDVAVFAALTGDDHPIHVDPDWAATGPFGRPIAHGLLVLSLAVGVLPLDPDRVLALRRFRDATFKRPVAVGESVIVSCRVTELKPIDAGTGIAICEWRITGTDDRLRVRAIVEILWRRGDSPVSAVAEAAAAPEPADPGLDPVMVGADGVVQVLV
jgi:acyl dehydratase